MTITLKLGGIWNGLAADTKPTLGTEQTGHEFYETDTFFKFIWTGIAWELVDQT